MKIEAWLERAASQAPRRVAVEASAGSLTYEQLLGRARVGAARLSELGARPGEQVAIALPAGLAFVEVLHACLLLGAVAVPVDLRLAANERERIAGGASVIVDQPLALDGEPAWPRAWHDLDSTALIVHTSGTTAAPRPVTLSYGNLLWSALGSGVALGVDPRERWLCAMPLSHVGGLSILLRSAIYATSAVVHERFETDRVLAALREDVTAVSLVATTLARLLDAGLERPPALRFALTGGGPVPVSLVRRAATAGVPVALTYGLTETCSQVTTTPFAEARAGRPTAGPPLFCTRVRIAGDGEILVAGPTVAPSAQLRDTEGAGGGWLATGDLGALDDRGRLQVLGRKADTIVTGGENVSPVEVEAVIEAHPDVLEAAVVGRSDERWGEALSAWIVRRPGAQLDIGALREHCRRSLASYKVPKDWGELDRPLPRTASGKLLRRELP